MIEAKLTDTILGLVRTRGGSVSFADLTLNVPGFTSDNPKRGYVMPYPEGANIVVWYNMSKVGADAIAELVRSYKIELLPTAPYIYAVDGLVPQMPVAKAVRAYRKQHWLPMIIGLGERRQSSLH
jgi:hypothetical protein